MKKKTLLIMLLVALFVPLAMNAQTKSLKRSDNGSKPKLEMRVSKEMPSNPMLSKLESAKEAALEELNGRGTRAAGDYELVTASQTDWSGEYVITAVSGTTANVLTGKASGGNYGAYTTATISNNTLASSAVDSYKVTIEPVTYNGNTYYTLKLGSNYLYMNQDGNYLWFNTSVATGNGARNYYWSLSYTSNYVKITNLRYPNTRYIRFNNNNNSRRFACYASTTTNTLDVSLFKKNDGCSAPEDFAASNVTTNSVTLSWTETGTSEEWAILYMCEEDTEAQVEFTTTNPFTLTGLNPATYYIAEVIPMCGDYDQESEVIEFTTQDLPCPKPTNLNASNLTPSSATVSWSGEADSYTLQYRPAADNGEAAFSDDFEDAWLDDFGDWTTYTQGDAFSGFGWFAYSPDDFMEEYSPGAHSGSVCAMAVSYGSNGALNANNYLVTPQVELGGTLKFWMWGDYEDEYEVLLSTGGNAIRDFTVTLQAMQAAPYNTWGEISIDLSRYAGQQGYIAIHHEMYDGDVIMLDDFGIYGDAQPAGAWETIENVTSPYTITGLDGETTYEWQVQGDCGADGESLWSAIGTFTTPTSCGAPSGLTTTNITGTSATLNWAEVLDEYNVTYTKGFVYDFESAEPWAVDSFDPCTTYDGDQTECYGFDGSEFTNFPFTGSTIAFQNQGGNLSSHSGNAFGLMVCPAPTSSSSAPPAANDWFILPEIAVESGDVFSFWAREITTNYGAEVINVGVYGTSQGTFSSYLAQNVQVASTEWAQYSYDLSAYAGQTIRLAINYVSLDIFGFMFDDIFVGDPNGWSDPITVKGSSYTLEGLSMNTDYVWQVQGVNCDGNGGTTDWSSASFTTLDGILVESITADDVEVVVGGTATITPTVLPADATNPAVTYTSNNTDIATVNTEGVVTGVAVGTTTITIAATDGSGITGTCNVTVNPVAVTEITADPTEITMITGENATFDYTVAPANATDPSVIFTSNDETIATVDEYGIVTSVGVGTTTITITSVSNPEVTAEITVTVNSNPDAAQFSVNAPANAQPGDVITVEAVLTAPTSGTYGGFNGLILDLEFDNTAVAYVNNSMVYGTVAQAAQQLNGFLYSSTLDNAVQLAISVFNEGSFVTADGVVFSAQFTVLEGVEGSFDFTAKPHTPDNFDHEGTSILYEFTPSTVTIGMLESYDLPITGYGTSNGGYYLIASPIGEVDPNDVTNMLSNSYDLYYFDQDQELEWINYKDSNDGNFNLVAGKGYLYANSNDVTLTFTGAAYSGDGKVTLHYNGDVDFAGWNLVGNPYATQTAYIDRPFYTMSSNGAEIIAAETTSIEPMQGVFVIAASDNEEMTFSTTNPNGKSAQLVINLTTNRNSVIDRAIVRFDESNRLPKFQLYPSHTKLYMPVNNKDYAVVNASEMAEMPVNFKAEHNGCYTLRFTPEEVDFSYLHLIDNMTGTDVDLLAYPSYSFNAKSTDYASRFKIVFATTTAVDEQFAYFIDGSLVINNEGNATLNVYDVTGRLVDTKNVNGSCQVGFNAVTGVYMIQLVNGNDVKTQKIVVK